MKDNFGITPLLCALWENHFKVAKYLIDKVSCNIKYNNIYLNGFQIINLIFFFREQLQIY